MLQWLSLKTAISLFLSVVALLTTVLKRLGLDKVCPVGIVANNGGSIRDYAGVNRMKPKILPMFAINTTSGTGSEMTRFAIITDKERQSKFPVWTGVAPQVFQ